MIAAGRAAATAFGANAALAAGGRIQAVTETIHAPADDMGLIGPDTQHHGSFAPKAGKFHYRPESTTLDGRMRPRTGVRGKCHEMAAGVFDRG